MHSPGSFSLMAIKTLSVPLFKSNSPGTMASMILSLEKVGIAVISHSWMRSKLLIAQTQALALSCCSAETPELGKHSRRNLVSLPCFITDELCRAKLSQLQKRCTSRSTR